LLAFSDKPGTLITSTLASFTIEATPDDVIAQYIKASLAV
jgi:hypothetical protein